MGRSPGTFKVSVCAKSVMVKHARFGELKSALQLQEKQTKTVTLALKSEQPPKEPASAPSAATASDMVRIETGRLEMGTKHVAARLQRCRKLDRASDCKRSSLRLELPSRTVAVNAYAIDRSEVTNERYGRCVSAGACMAPAYQGAGPNHPVIGVSASDAAVYCTWLGRRLPTDAEWEMAARGPSGRLYPWGNSLPDRTRGNTCDQSCGKKWRWNEWNDGYPGTAPVDSFPAGATADGISDLCGNVWEWVKAENGGVVVRGGSYVNAPVNCESAARVSISGKSRRKDTGFRCAK